VNCNLTAPRLFVLTFDLLYALQPVFDLLLWSVEQVQEYQAPTYEFAVSVLQTISHVSSALSEAAAGCKGVHSSLRSQRNHHCS
jgi:hypothetical protein